MDIKEYKKELENRELAKSTITKYLKDVSDFLKYVGDEELTQEKLISYKKELIDKHKVNTVNTKITIINNYLAFNDKNISVKHERVQTSNTLDNVLSQKDFNRIVRMANRKDNERARVTLLSLYHTGLRVSELKFITVAAVNRGRIDINNKGKHRTVGINKELTKILKKYIKDNKLISGPIILNNNGDSLSRNYIYKEMKYLGGQARVKLSKVYPHSIRHLFAKRYLKDNNNDMTALANILGHSSLDTTRIYGTLSTKEQAATMDLNIPHELKQL